MLIFCFVFGFCLGGSPALFLGRAIRFLLEGCQPSLADVDFDLVSTGATLDLDRHSSPLSMFLCLFSLRPAALRYAIWDYERHGRHLSVPFGSICAWWPHTLPRPAP